MAAAGGVAMDAAAVTAMCTEDGSRDFRTVMVGAADRPLADRRLADRRLIDMDDGAVRAVATPARMHRLLQAPQRLARRRLPPADRSKISCVGSS
jgi:hypothetical protein